jgi:hypothetical protein
MVSIMEKDVKKKINWSNIKKGITTEQKEASYSNQYMYQIGPLLFFQEEEKNYRCLGQL